MTGRAERGVDPGLHRRERGRGVEVVGESGEHRLDDGEGRRPSAQRERLAPGVHGVDGIPQELVGPLPVGPVVVPQQDQPDGHRVDVAVPEGGDEDQVALRLRHLLPVVAHHPGVRVGLGERRARHRDLGLPGAHLVVREDQVAAAGLDVEGRAEVFQGHGGALDVPPRPAPPEGAVPGRLAGTLAPPHDTVEGVALALALGVAAALAEDLEHPVARPAGHLAEGGVGGDREVEVVVDAVGRAGRVEPLDQRHHERDRLDGADEVGRRDDPQGRHVLAEQLGLPLGQLHPVDVHLRGPLEQRVVDVGDVLDVGDLVAGVDPRPVQEVEGDVRRGVAHVGGVVGRDPADVEPGRALARILGTGGHDLAGGGVVEAHGRTHHVETRDVGSRPGAHGGKSRTGAVRTAATG